MVEHGKIKNTKFVEVNLGAVKDNILSNEKIIIETQGNVEKVKLTRRPSAWYPAFEDLSDKDKSLYYAYGTSEKADLKVYGMLIPALAPEKKALFQVNLRNDTLNNIGIDTNRMQDTTYKVVNKNENIGYVAEVYGNGSTNLQFHLTSKDKGNNNLYAYFEKPEVYVEYEGGGK